MDRATLLSELDSVLPGFAEYFASDKNLFEGEEPCAVFASCSHFVRESAVSDTAWPGVGRLVQRALDGSDPGMAEAALACFLENLASSIHPLKQHLRGEALQFWKQWEGA